MRSVVCRPRFGNGPMSTRSSSPRDFYFWRHCGEYIRAVLRAPLARREKLQLLYGVLKRSVASRGALAHELSAGVLAKRRDKS